MCISNSIPNYHHQRRMAHWLRSSFIKYRHSRVPAQSTSSEQFGMLSTHCERLFLPASTLCYRWRLLCRPASTQSSPKPSALPAPCTKSIRSTLLFFYHVKATSKAWVHYKQLSLRKPLPSTKNCGHNSPKSSLGFFPRHRKSIHGEHCSCKPPLRYLGWRRWREVLLESPWVVFVIPYSAFHKNQKYFHSSQESPGMKHTAAFIEEHVWQA